MKRIMMWAAAVVLPLLMAGPASAHFLWLVPNAESGRVEVYFAESADPDDPDLLDRIKGLVIRQRTNDGRTIESPAERRDDWLAITPKAMNGTFGLVHDYGIITRGESTFLLTYAAKTYAETDPARWASIESKQGPALDLSATMAGGKLVLEATWKGEPLADAEIVVDTPDLDRTKATTDAKGRFSVALKETGAVAARVKHVEARKGKLGGKSFGDVRHYTTLTLAVGDKPSRKLEPEKEATSSLPDLPFGITSFGAAVLDGRAYVVGGNKGDAHSYDNKGQNNQLLMLDLAQPKNGWKVVGETPRRQGLAVVAHGRHLYRIGGFEARNDEGENHDLHSTNEFARFDPKSRKWESLTDLPDPRSSHDAVVIGDHLYVVGGWDMQGQHSHWHDTALVADLSANEIEWTELPAPKFERRALSVGDWNGKLVAVGGMQTEGGPTSKTSIYDPAKKTWSDGPDLLGEGRLGGFGSSAFRCGAGLYVTPHDGGLQRLSNDGKSWVRVGKLAHPRFFHRLLAVDDRTLIAIGGAHMSSGKVLETELITVDPEARTAASGR